MIYLIFVILIILIIYGRYFLVYLELCMSLVIWERKFVVYEFMVLDNDDDDDVN